jgi:hypothetical protein
MRFFLPLVVALIPLLSSRAPAQACSDCSLGLQLPVISSVAIAGDTVWFCSEVSAETNYLANYVWIAGAALPSRLGSPAHTPCGPSGARRIPRADNHHATIAVLPPSTSNARSSLALVDSTSHTTIALRARFTPRILARIRGYGESLAKDTVSVGVSAVAIDDTVAWLGLDGGFGESGGALGGLYHVNRRTKSYALITNELLDNSRVTDMALTPPWLWLGTDSPSEYFRHGESGLLRLNLRTHSWRQYTNTSSPLPDPLIRAMSSDTRVIAVATETGLAVAELRAGPRAKGAQESRGEDEAIAKWHVGYFRPGFVGDSLVFDLGATNSLGVDPGLSSLVEMLERETPRGRERPTFAALTDPAAAAASPTGVSALVAMLAVPGDKQSLAATAVGRMGSRVPTVVLDSLRAQFFHADSLGPAANGRRVGSRTSIGFALSAVGDSTAVTWSRGTLENAIARGAPPSRPDSAELSSIDLSASAQILSAVHDRDGLRLLIRAAPFVTSGWRAVVISQIAQYDEPFAWNAMVSLARDRGLATYVLRDLQPAALRDSTVAAHVRRFMGDVAASNERSSLIDGTDAIARLRLIAIAPLLIEKLRPGQLNGAGDAERVLSALVSLSGRSDAPVFHAANPPKAVYDWWRRWLASSKGVSRAVPAASGDAAARRWEARFEAAQR